MSKKTLVPINLPSAAVDPTVPTLRAGDVYVNSTSKAVRAYDGAAWHEHDTLDQATTLSGAKTFTGGVVVNTTGITGNKEINLTGTGASSVAGTLQGTALIAAGLTGSTAASRYVGATTTGSPSTGAHLLGDWVVTQDGHMFVCTVAGTPGTWVNAGTASVLATSVTSETTYGIASAVGTSTNVARQDHTHGTPSTPVTSAVAGTGIGVSGATGAVTISNTGALLTANTFTGLQTFNAGVTVPAGQPMTTGTRSILTGTRSTTTNASDTVDLGTFATTAGTMELRVHAHLVAGAAGATASVTKVYELALNNAMGTANTWYLVFPSDASANAAATNDFALEVQRTSGTTFNFRFRQKSIAATGTITWTVETLGDTAITFTPSTTVTAAPTAVTTMHPSNAHVEAAGQVGIGKENPAVMLDVAGAISSTGNITENGNRVYSAGNPPPASGVTMAAAEQAGSSTSATPSSYVDLADGAHPAVTLTPGASGIAVIALTWTSTTNGADKMSVDVSGGNTVAASDTNSVKRVANGNTTASGFVVLTGLAASSTTFTAKYNAASTLNTFVSRSIAVWTW